MAEHLVRVGPLPAWLDRSRLLGPGDWTHTGEVAEASLPLRDAADLDARLRGLGFAGQPLAVSAQPPLPRAAVRAARTEDARRRRDTSAGFTRPGTRLDEEGRVSLTPEAQALEIGQWARSVAGPEALVLDAGAGAGGSAIGFARAGLRVLAVERDASRLGLLRHNARVYGVADRIEARVGDAVEAAASLHAQVLHVDPPWGTDWARAGCTIDALPLLQALAPHLERFPHVVLKLPPSFDPAPFPELTPRAVFGAASGDARRVKLLLLTR